MERQEKDLLEQDFSQIPEVRAVSQDGSDGIVSLFTSSTTTFLDQESVLASDDCKFTPLIYTY
jgi:hypothetical protein